MKQLLGAGLALALLTTLALSSPRGAHASNPGACATVAITGYEQYYTTSVANGEAKGIAFTFGRDEMIATGAAVSKIRAWVGERYLAGLEITLSDGAIRKFGHSNGGDKVYVFNGDEVLTYYEQYKSEDEAKKVAGIYFKTSRGGEFKAKATEGSDGTPCSIGCSDCQVKSIASGILAGFTGYVDGDGGGDIRRLTPIILRTVTSTEMTNMTYTELDDAPPPTSNVLYDYPVYNNANSVSITKFTQSITEKTAITWSVTASFKFSFLQSFKLSVSGGAPAVGAVSTESTTQYSWEVTATASASMTIEQTKTYTQEFTFQCPAMTSCRFVVSQGQGDLDDRYNEFTAIYTVYLDSGVSLPYVVTGGVAANELTPYSQSIVSEPIPPASAAIESAAIQSLQKMPPTLRRRPGNPPMLMYRKCPLVNNTQLCTGERAPASVVRAVALHLMMTDRAITIAQDAMPIIPRHIAVNYAAPFNYRRGPPRPLPR